MTHGQSLLVSGTFILYWLELKHQPVRLAAVQLIDAKPKLPAMPFAANFVVESLGQHLALIECLSRADNGAGERESTQAHRAAQAVGCRPSFKATPGISRAAESNTASMPSMLRTPVFPLDFNSLYEQRLTSKTETHFLG